MSKKPWSPETKARRASAQATFKKPAPTDAPPAAPTETPPPLPPFGSEQPAPEAGAVPNFDEAKIKGGLGRAFCSSTQGLANLTNYFLKTTPYRIEFDPVTPPEGDLWAEFAYPVIKARLPDLEKSPTTVLIVMTGIILSGKIQIKKKEPSNVGTQQTAGHTDTEN